MKSSRLPLFALVILTVLTGCASTSAVTPYGRDSYVVSAADTSGFTSPEKLHANAAEKANAFCANQGKVMIARDNSGQRTPDWTITASSLIFSCIGGNDSEYTRSDLRRQPDTVIEDRRK
jgi:hypothetical protein